MDDLTAFRRQHGLKGKDVAEILGYSPEHISRCEHGTKNLSRTAWRVLECHVRHTAMIAAGEGA